MSSQPLDVGVRRQLAHEAAVHPAQLALVEDRRGAAHPVDREALDQLVGAENRRIVLGAPPEQGEVVADRSGQIALPTQLLHGGAAVSLRQLAAVRPVEERQVRVARRNGVERAQNQQLLRRVREVIVAANHVGDPHVRIVHRDREVVQRGAVATRDHEVVLGPVLEPNRPADQVLDHRHPVVRDAQANRRAGTVPGLAAVPRASVGPLPGANVVCGGRVGIGVTALDQLCDPLAVTLTALVLAQRPVVPVELQPAQGIQDLLDVLRHGALTVGVLDPQHELPARVPGEKPVVERGAGAADVQGARGRWGEAIAGRRGTAHGRPAPMFPQHSRLSARLGLRC